MRKLAAIAAALAVVCTAAAASAGNGDPLNYGSKNAFTLGVIGDTPYGAQQIADFPVETVPAINGDPKVDFVLHLGDIKNGSSVCSSEYYDLIFGYFGLFKDPLVYTPGDNEWTDCHRPNNGAYNPLERLARIRSEFFPQPGVTLGGRKKQVLAEPFFPENVLWMQSQVVFATVHVVGSNNSLAPWTGATSPNASQFAEYVARNAANLEWLDSAFTLARDADADGVVIAMQADMWDGTPVDGFDDTVQTLATRARELGKPVLLLEGDSHTFVSDYPLASGSPKHGVTTAAPNLHRIVVEGAATVHEWLRLTVDPKTEGVFSIERVNL